MVGRLEAQAVDQEIVAGKKPGAHDVALEERGSGRTRKGNAQLA
jgi:hypothetical protein